MATLPEPVNVFFGGVQVGGVPITSGTVTVVLDGQTQPLVSYGLGSSESLGQSQYMLPVPVDSVGAQAAGTARPGDLARFYVDGQLAARTTIEARGTPRQLDLDTRFNDVDLAVTLAASADPVLAGNELIYTLTVANAGPGAEIGGILSHTLPSGASFLGVVFDQGSCSHASGVVTCQLGPIPGGEDTEIEVTVSVDSSVAHASVLGSLASVSGTETDELASADNSKTLLSIVHRSTDLEILSHLAAPEPVVAGQPLTYTLSLKNNGPSLASAVNLLDTLPAGLTLAQAAPSQGSCSGAVVVTCALGNLARGAAATISLTANVPASIAADAILTNQAALAGAENDPGGGISASSAQSTARREIDLAVVHTDWPATATAGQGASYVVKLTNQGVSDASAVTLTSTLPAGFHFESVLPQSGCAVSDTAVTCDIGALASGASTTRTISGTVSSLLEDGAVLVNTASASALATEIDLVAANDSSTRQTVVSSVADLALALAAAPSPATAGSGLTYSLSVTNHGPSDAAGVVLASTLPAQVSFVSFQVQPDRLLYSVDQASDQLRVIRPDTGASASSVFIQLGGERVTGGFGLASHPATLQLWALLELEGQAGTQLVQLNPATGVATSIGDTGLELGSLAFALDGILYAISSDTASPPETFYRLDTTDASPSIVLDLGSGTSGEALALDSHSGLLYHVSGKATAPGAILESIALAAPAVRTPIAPFGVPYWTPAALVGSAPDVLLLADERRNLHQLTAGGIVTAIGAMDHVSGGLAFAPRGGACAENAGTVVCQLGRLGSNESLTVSLDVLVDPDASAPLTNRATVTSSSVDAAPANSTDVQQVTPVGSSADLVLGHVPDPSPAIAGQELTITLEVLNSGPSTSKQAVLSDTLPPGASFVSASTDPPGGVCTHSSGSLQCTLGDLDPGQSVRASLVLDIDPAFRGTLTNLASATSPVSDPAAANSTDVAQLLEVGSQAGLSVTQSAVPQTAVAGTTLTYPVVVSNAGPSQALDVQLTSTLAGEVELLGGAVGGTSCARVAQVLSCELGALDPGQTATLVLTAQVPSGAAAGAIWTSKAEVGGGDPDPQPLDNEAQAQATVERQSDLALLQAGTVDSVLVGEPLAYDLVVSNDGPSDASGLSLVHSLPTGASFDAGASSAECSATGNQVTCLRAALAKDGTWPVTVSLTLDPALGDGAVLSSTATVTSAEPDAAPSDNTRTLQTSVGSLCVRSSGCFDWALVHGNAEPDRQNVSFTWRVTNRCASPMQRLELRFRPGAAVTGFTEGQSYVSTNGRAYTVRLIPGTNGGVAFEPAGTGIRSGQFDVFTIRARSEDLVDQTQFWLAATAADGQPAGSISHWSTCFKPSARLSVVEPSACSRSSAETDLDSLEIRWRIHPWAASKRFQLYRIEAGNPSPVPLAVQPLLPDASGFVRFVDTVVAGLHPDYEIEPLDADGNPLESVVLASAVCQAVVSQPAPTWWAFLPLALGLGILAGRLRGARPGGFGVLFWLFALLPFGPFTGLRAEIAKVPAEGEKVVATVGEEKITVRDLIGTASGRASGGDLATPEQKEALLQQRLDLELLAAAARREGYDRDPEFLDEIKRRLAARVRSELLEPRLAGARVSDEEIAAHYREHAALYATPEAVSGAVILFRVPRGASDAKKAEIEQRAERILAELEAQKGDRKAFARLAVQHSGDQATRYIRGETGWLERGANLRWDPAVAEALFALQQPGQLGALLRSESGFTIVQLLERRQPGLRPLEQVSASIRGQLLKARREKLRQEFYAQLRSEVNIEVDRAVLESAELPAPARAEQPEEGPPPLPSD